MGPRGERLGHGAAHLLLLGTVLAAGHLRRDLVEPLDTLVTGLPGVDPPAGAHGGREVVVDLEGGNRRAVVSGLVGPVLCHPPIMPAGGDTPRRPG